MNSSILDRLVKAAPFAIAVFATVLMVHGLHVVSSGDEGGNSGPNLLHIISSGDEGGNSGPN